MADSRVSTAEHRERSKMDSSGSLRRTVLTSGAGRPGSPKNTGASGVWAEVFQACNKGFQTKMNVLGAEILESVRGEVKSALTSFRQEMTQLQRPVINSLTDITERALILQETVDNSNQMDWKKVFDLRPVLDELHAAEVLQRDSDRKLGQTNERMDQVVRVVEQMRKDTEEKVVQRLTEKITDSNVKLSEISKVVEELNAAAKHIASSVNKMQQQEVQHFEEVSGMMTGLEVQLSKSSSRSSSVVDVTPIISAMHNTKDEVTLSFNHVLNEISSIQKALHIEFSETGTGGSLGKAVRTAQGGVAIVEYVDEEEERPATEIMSSTSLPPHVTLDNKPSAILDQPTSTEESAVGKEKSIKVRKRMREFWAQTEIIDAKEQWVQTMPISEKVKKTKKNDASLRQKNPGGEGDKKKNGVLADAEELRRKARLALMQPQYNVFDYYCDTGCAQWIARSPIFENITLLIVAVNAIWLAIDTDYNDASTLIDAHPVFQIMEHSFAVFFVGELLTRFLAFQEKRNALRDGWFLFDLFLVIFMVLDTWVLSLVYLILREEGATLTLDISIVKMIRVFKLLRLSRLAKLLKQLPELIIIIKGIGFAARSVFVFFLLWIIIIYVFSVFITQLANGNEGLQLYFKSVLESMNTLLLQGIFADNASTINEMTRANWFLWPIMIGFILLVGITTLYMLVGVLVEVMGVISTTEKEGMTVAALSTALRERLETLGFNLGVPIVQYELQKALAMPELARVIQDVGVDIVVLMDMMDLVYEEAEKKGGLTFENLIEAILDMRGSNPASVKDIKEHLRVIKFVVLEQSTKMTMDFTEQLNMLKADVQAIRDSGDDERGDDERESQNGSDAPLEAEPEEKPEDIQSGE